MLAYEASLSAHNMKEDPEFKAIYDKYEKTMEEFFSKVKENAANAKKQQE